MTPRRLDWTLRTRGTVIADWPGAERDAAVVLLRQSRAARAMLADALVRDDSQAAASDPCALERMQAALRLTLLQLPPLPFAVRWGVLATCAAAGIYLGAVEATARDAGPETDAFAAVQMATVAGNP